MHTGSAWWLDAPAEALFDSQTHRWRSYLAAWCALRPRWHAWPQVRVNAFATTYSNTRVLLGGAHGHICACSSRPRTAARARWGRGDARPHTCVLGGGMPLQAFGEALGAAGGLSRTPCGPNEAARQWQQCTPGSGSSAPQAVAAVHPWQW